MVLIIETNIRVTDGTDKNVIFAHQRYLKQSLTIDMYLLL